MTKLYRMPPDVKAMYGAMRYIAGGDPIRSEEWLDWIRQMDCIRCGRRGPSDAHHIFGSFGSGMKGCKTSDVYTVPVCRPCHREVQGRTEFFLQMLVAWFGLIDKYLRRQINK